MAKSNTSRIVIWTVVGILVVVAAVMFLKKPKDATVSGPPVDAQMIEKQIGRVDKFDAKVAAAQAEFPGTPPEKWQAVSDKSAKARQTLTEMQSLTDQGALKAKLSDAQKSLIEARALLREITGKAEEEGAGQ